MEAHRDDRGIAATWLAVVFLFLMAAMALGADTAAFFRSAGVDQTVADLACLAGVQELPAAPQRALLVAGENVKANFPRVASATPVLTVDQSILSLGENVITINTNWSGDSNKMRVHMTSSEARGFSHIWSSSDVLVTQEAICAATPANVGPGLLPIGAAPGGFTGTLDACTDSGSTAACGTLDVGNGSDWRNAVAIGLDGDFEKHHGYFIDPDASTGHVGTECGPPYRSSCNAMQTEPRATEHSLLRGIEIRLNIADDADCLQNGTFNCDSLIQVLGATVETLYQTFGDSAPEWWEPSLYGPYRASMNTQYWYDGNVEKCDSVRLATVPIVAYDLDWDIGAAGGAWPETRALMKIIDFYTIFIREPSDISEMGSGPVVADVVWFGPNTTCDGDPVDFYGGIAVSGTIKLVAS